MPTTEHQRVSSDEPWDLWGPYLAERAWGTVREDYSARGRPWSSFTHDHARGRAYRWNEDGLLGICDKSQYLCLALAMWNGHDPIIKERLFGLTGPEGNHGEDVKEAFWFLDATPTHSLLRARYRYPLAAFPYDELLEENARRGVADSEYEIVDTGVFDDSRFFDIDVTYAKASPNDIVMQIAATNLASEEAPLWLLPTLWFRNTWSWGYPRGPRGDIDSRPFAVASPGGVTAWHPVLGEYTLTVPEDAEVWFTKNETNPWVFGYDPEPGKKDAFHRRLIGGEDATLEGGTKAAAVLHRVLAPGETWVSHLRLASAQAGLSKADPWEAGLSEGERLVEQRSADADEYWAAAQPSEMDGEARAIHRAAMAGLVWSKQLYGFDVAQWLDGDPAGPTPEGRRAEGRNAGWRHLNNFDVISMPDVWEYPWYASWDLAFHAVAFAGFDPAFAKANLRLLTREWYLHPNGQLPAYEWDFGNVNPPVMAWAVRRVHALDRDLNGAEDPVFLEAVFHKLLLNFTWWVNRKDADGNNVFQGGFLGLDNISLFDRSAGVPGGGHVDQSDGTAWMGFYTLGMLRIALDLAHKRPAYQDVATKFYEHFLSIAAAINDPAAGLWDEEDGFFYDVLHLPGGRIEPLKVRSLVGLIPLLAVEVVEQDVLAATPDFVDRMAWYAQYRPELQRYVAGDQPDRSGRLLLSLLDEGKLRSVLRYLLNPDEFLSPYGIRSLSKVHAEEPYELTMEGVTFRIGYEPGEALTPILGGNSNWRGPIWVPINYLVIEALREYAVYYGDDFTIEFPTGSGREATLDEIADDLAHRVASLYRFGSDDTLPFLGDSARYRDDDRWHEPLFYEYFHADTGAGLGASHQTGWTALVGTLLAELADRG